MAGCHDANITIKITMPKSRCLFMFSPCYSAGFLSVPFCLNPVSKLPGAKAYPIAQKEL
jgi:hypothetical protein